jgi:hypothetical protein
MLLSLPCILSAQEIFDHFDQFFQNFVQDGLVDYEAVRTESNLTDLTERIAQTDLADWTDVQRKAFYINSYNVLVIDGIARALPIESVLAVEGFFDREKHRVAGSAITLEQLEKDLIQETGDARIHFALVCAALGCPPIQAFAYVPEKLEAQLDQISREALQLTSIYQQVSDTEIALNPIFKWYVQDFGGKSGVIEFVEQYRAVELPDNIKINYLDYDWSLNVVRSGEAALEGNNANRYVVSSTIPRGGFEFRLFNNLYSQQTGSMDELQNRSNFFTGLFSVLYGVNDRFNAGFDLRYRRVLNSENPSSAFDVFGTNQDPTSFRQGLTYAGLKIRWAPIPKWENFSIQSAFGWGIGDSLEGSSNSPYIDWQGKSWWTQFFNDFDLGQQFSLFTEIDFLWEDIASTENGGFNRVSTPATIALNYFPEKNTSIYAIAGYSPFWTPNFDYFYQAGLGLKYQVTRDFELELLYTHFDNQFLADNSGRASTVNFGLRYSTRRRN